MCTATLITATADKNLEPNRLDVDRETDASPKIERRRRNIDPTTCERDYSYDEIEFMQALDEYKRKAKRMFPTCSEILEVLDTLGYAKDVALDES